MTRGVIALIGSGETAPSMTKVHRQLLARYENPRLRLLDTTYGFQENVPQMTQKLVDYFATSLHVDLEPVSFPRYDPASTVENALVKQRVSEADYIFAGPGSPTYALAQWTPLDLAADLLHALGHGATICFASAASLTLGEATAPIYEVYKVGEDPRWRPGLDVLATFGLQAAVIPHWDNAEGRDYDTTRCFLGERRLSILEADLPPETAICGIDEHTALIFDLETDTAHAVGRGSGYWRHGTSVVAIDSAPIPLEALRSDIPSRHISTPPVAAPPLGPLELAEAASAGDTSALVELVRLAASSPRHDSRIDAVVDAVLVLRENLRSERAYEIADRLRDALVDSGVILEDTPEGPAWSWV